MKARGEVSGSAKFAVERLDVYWAAVDYLNLFHATGDRTWRRNAALCRQLQRAIASVISNIGEAASSLTRGDRRRYFEYAYRSAGECSALFVALHAIGGSTDEQADRGRKLLHRIQMMLMRLMQRSGSSQEGRQSAKPPAER